MSAENETFLLDGNCILSKKQIADGIFFELWIIEPTKFFQVFAFGQYIDEVERRSKAIRMANKLAKEHNHDFINIDGLMQKVY